jgi:hypothetical protein
MWTAYPKNIDEPQRPSHIAKKTMATAFFNRTRLYILDILPQIQRMEVEFFVDQIISSLVSICYPNGMRF